MVATAAMPTAATTVAATAAASTAAMPATTEVRAAAEMRPAAGSELGVRNRMPAAAMDRRGTTAD
jgi:hypothetical protein